MRSCVRRQRSDCETAARNIHDSAEFTMTSRVCRRLTPFDMMWRGFRLLRGPESLPCMHISQFSISMFLPRGTKNVTFTRRGCCDGGFKIKNAQLGNLESYIFLPRCRSRNRVQPVFLSVFFSRSTFFGHPPFCHVPNLRLPTPPNLSHEDGYDGYLSESSPAQCITPWHGLVLRSCARK